MRNWMKQLAVSVSLVFTVGGPSTALAYPPQCYEVCTCESSCDEPCYYMNYYQTTCGGFGASCVDSCRGSAPQASASQEAQEQRKQHESQQAGDACTKQAPQPASSES